MVAVGSSELILLLRAFATADTPFRHSAKYSLALRAAANQGGPWEKSYRIEFRVISTEPHVTSGLLHAFLSPSMR